MQSVKVLVFVVLLFAEQIFLSEVTAELKKDGFPFQVISNFVIQILI